MTQGTYSVLATHLRMVLRWLEAQGEKPAEHFQRHGLNVKTLNQPRERLPAAAVDALLADLRDRFKRPCLGTELAEYHRLNDTHAVGITLLASDHGLAALERGLRYQRLLSSHATMHLDETGNQVALTFAPQGFEESRDVLGPYLFAMIWQCMKMAAPPTLRPLSITLALPKPDNRCFETAMGCKVSWSQSVTAMIFDKAQLLESWQMSNTEIIRANEPMLDNLLKSLRTGDVAGRVRWQLLDALDEQLPSEEDVAQALHMSPRTLQRRLKSENTSYGEVVQQTRMQLAQQLLASPDISATEVGLACGFSDASAFTRAFKRCTGTTPSDYRNEARDAVDLEEGVSKSS
ncbi:AraC family transcriptional regulator [Luminiphilus sp.]|nr:AraC family transcriptional regulator [Luminiphilus sp.]MDC3405273.1 AraC family transcriptional regulator [Luminiphilus sp.]